MTFTIEDARDDAKILNEVKGSLVRTAKRNSKIWEAFENVCEQMGQDPGVVLSNMLVRALNNEEYAEDIRDTEVTMEVLNTGEYRKEDVETVKEFANTLDLMPEDNSNPVDELIRKRLDAVSGGPFDQMSNGDGPSDREIAELKKEIRRLENMLEQERSQQTTGRGEREEDTRQTTNEETERKDLDDIFGEDDSEPIVEGEDEEEDDDDVEEEDESFSDVEIEEINTIEDTIEEEEEGEEEEDDEDG